MPGDGATQVFRLGWYTASYFSRPAMPDDMEATTLVEDPYFRLATRTSPSDDKSHAPLPGSGSCRELPPV